MDEYRQALRLATTTGQAQAACSRAAEAIASLRFHEGLRRRWENARAEAAVREATAVCLLEGVRTSVDDLRLLSLAQGADASSPAGGMSPGEALAVGIWRSQWHVACDLPPLNTRQPHAPCATVPLPARMAGLHRDVASGALARGDVDASTVAFPQLPSQVRAAHLLVTGAVRGDLPAWGVAADLWARFRTYEIFTPASGAVGAALARWLLVHRGVEPTGVAVVSAWHTVNTAQSAQSLAAWERAQDPTLSVEARGALLGQWVASFALGVEHGAGLGADVALRIQASRLGQEPASTQG